MSAFDDALFAHQCGDIPVAERAYKKHLRAHPKDAEAHYLLGTLFTQSARHDRALEHLQKAAQLGKKDPSLFNNLGLALQAAGDFKQSISFFDRALELNPTYVSALFNRAMAYADLRRWPEALADIEAVLVHEPFAADAKVLKGRYLKELTRYDEALEIFSFLAETSPPSAELNIEIGNVHLAELRTEKALSFFDLACKTAPLLGKAHFLKGSALLNLERFSEALDELELACKLDPNSTPSFLALARAHFANKDYERAEAVLNGCFDAKGYLADIAILRGHIARKRNKWDEAQAFYQEAALLLPNSADLIGFQADMCVELQKYNEALELLNRAVAMAPENATIRVNKSAILDRLGFNDEAMAEIDFALKIQPNFMEALSNRGQIYFSRGDYNEAIADFRLALEVKEDAVPRFNLSLVQLTLGNLDWNNYEARTGSPTWRSEVARLLEMSASRYLLRFSPDALKGKSVLVLEEQAIGDIVMFATVLPDLVAIAKEVVFLTNARLQSIFQRAFPSVEVVAIEQLPQGFDINRFDVTVLVGSLCYAFRQSPQDFPGKPFLVADAERVACWKERLPKGKKLVGLSWRGGTVENRQKDRSLDLTTFLPLLKRDDLSFVSIQFGKVDPEVLAFNEAQGTGLLRFDQDDFRNIDDLAALIEALDCVVTVQNTNVHLAGALGKTCYAILPQRPEWRYGSHHSKMLWYNSVELFRRTDQTEVSDVIAAINARL